MIKFQLTAQDWIDATRLYIRWTVNNWLVRAAGGGMLVVAGVLFELNDNVPEAFGIVSTLLISLPVAIWIVIPVVQLVSIPMIARHLFQQTRAAGDLTEADWNDVAITFSAENWHHKLNWQAFVGWRDNRKVHLLFINDQQFHIIPKRAFNDASTATEFGQLVKSKVPRK